MAPSLCSRLTFLFCLLFIFPFHAGGILVALTVKFTDNIIKGFAASISIIVSCIFSAIFIDFEVTLIFSIGAVITICTTVLYSLPDAPSSNTHDKDVRSTTDVPVISNEMPTRIHNHNSEV